MSQFLPHWQVGTQVYERVPLYMRTQLWKSLLIHADTQQKARPANDDVTICDASFYNTLLEVRCLLNQLFNHKEPCSQHCLTMW